MKTEKIQIDKLRLNEANPRTIKDEKFKKLIKSIKEFPQMLEIRPIVVDNDMTVLGGNMRLRACIEAGLTHVPVIRASELTDEQKQRFIIADNVGFGEWDWEALANEWDAGDLDEWGLDVPGFDNNTGSLNNESEARNKLQEVFLVPPFSVLDTRQGYWQERKRYWKALIQDEGESRADTLYRSKGDPVSEKLRESGGVSILDPVLSELVCKWFGLPNCNTFDPFAGDTVFGYVSSYLGNAFTGIELREEQAEINNKRVADLNARYVCDDGRNVLQYLGLETQDLLFSCPPYFDLEIYSTLPNDASNQKEYTDFIKILDQAFTDSIKCLKQDRFAVVVVGDVRDKNTGFYYRFVDDVKDIFTCGGCLLYNELILIESSGNAALKAGRNMDTRKVTKCHQNILVFFKGNPKKIKGIFPKIKLQEQEDEISDVEL